MARRRMIDPNFWGSEDVSKLTIQQRLLLIGLFSNADDYGRGRANPNFIRSMVFPYDDLEIQEIECDLDMIGKVASIKFYAVDSSNYYEFLNWDKWQTVQKPQPSKIPTSKDIVENDSGIIPELVENDSCLKERKGKEVKGKEVKGKEGDEMPSTDFNPHKDRIHKLINECEIQEYNLHDLDVIFSYIGVVDMEVIEAAIKKGQKKESIKYALKTLQGMVRDGITKKEQVLPKPQVGDYDAKKHEGQFQHGGTPTENKSITGGAVGWLPSKAKSNSNIVQLPNVSG